jgi:hypothetical protein
VFSARYELNLCIKGFHQRLPHRAMARTVSTRCLASKNPSFRLGQSMGNFWRSKRPWDSSLPQYFSFPLSVSLHRCSGVITLMILFIRRTSGRRVGTFKHANGHQGRELDKVLQPRFSFHYKKPRQPARRHRTSPFRSAFTSHVRGVVVI